jgi:hypothetical protein
LGSLRGGKFASGKEGNANHGKPSPEKQNDLPERKTELTPGNAAAGAERINRGEILG